MSSAVKVFDAETGQWVAKKPPRSAASGVPALIGPTSARPHLTESSGVLPHQVAEARQAIKEHGLVGVDVRPDGLVVSTCRGKRGASGLNGWMALRGHTDKNGGFGDV